MAKDMTDDKTMFPVPKGTGHKNRQKEPGSFFLSMQLIVDALERELIQTRYFGDRDAGRLKQVRLFYPEIPLESRCVYLVDAREVPEGLRAYPGSCFIVNGWMDEALFPDRGAVILIPIARKLLAVMAFVQGIFEKYQTWDYDLHDAIQRGKPLTEMLKVSIGIFRNPLFIHDRTFHIMADPYHTPTMTRWDTDPDTGRSMVNHELINDFRTDPEYLEGMKARKAVVFSADQTGYRIFFRNLWRKDEYEGRILIDEVQNTLMPGDLYALDYLGNLVEKCLEYKKIVWLSMGNDLKDFLRNFISREKIDERQYITYMRYLGWEKQGRYCCMRLLTDEKEFNLRSADATIYQIEITVPECVAFYYDNSITIVLNLAEEETIASVVSRLAVVIRDGLLKVGISSEIQDFALLPEAYKQAHIALDYGTVSNSMYWYYYFDDYTLDYILDCAGKEMPLELLNSEALRKLKKYDRENNSDLYHTLKVYLTLEKNVLQTSKALFIHRSTLSYRLERIEKLTGVNLDKPRERLQLLLSFYMDEGIEDSQEEPEEGKRP